VFVLEINEREGESRRVQIGGDEATIGRHSSNNVQLARGNVSKRHARIVRRDDTLLRFVQEDRALRTNGRRCATARTARRLRCDRHRRDPLES